MSVPNLSAGVVRAMHSDSQPVSEPIVQVIDVKKIQAAANAQTERFRLIISDGVNYQQAMLATQLNDLIKNEVIQNKCILKLVDFICNTVHNKRIVIILNCELVAPPCASIGNPTNIETAGGAAPAAAPAPQPTTNNNNRNVAPLPRPNPTTTSTYKPPAVVNRPAQQANRAPISNNAASPAGGGTIYPIARLNPYQSRWTIKARVTAKGEIRTWNNAKGSGKLFHVDLLDESGAIRATMFNDAVDNFFDVFQVDKIYMISKGSLKIANKKFSSINNEYELALDQNALVSPCADEDSIPRQKYELVPIAEIRNFDADRTIDVIAVIASTGAVAQIKTRNGKDLTKRTVTLVDTSSASIEFTLWGASAENISWHESEHPVVVVTGVKVSNFNQKSLTGVGSTHVEVNPDVPEAYNLRQWYDDQNGNINLTSLTQSSYQPGSFNGPSGPAERKSLAQVKGDPSFGRGGAVSFESKCFITNIKHENANLWYEACPNCSKKVQLVDGGYRCESLKCQNQVYPDCEKRYILSFAVADFSSSVWMNAFNEVGVQILGIDANTLAIQRDNNPNEYEETFQKLKMKQFHFTVRAKEESFGDKGPQIKYTVVKCRPVDFISDTEELIRQLSLEA